MSGILYSLMMEEDKNQSSNRYLRIPEHAQEPTRS